MRYVVVIQILDDFNFRRIDKYDDFVITFRKAVNNDEDFNEITLLQILQYRRVSVSNTLPDLFFSLKTPLRTQKIHGNWPKKKRQSSLQPWTRIFASKSVFIPMLRISSYRRDQWHNMKTARDLVDRILITCLFQLHRPLYSSTHLWSCYCWIVDWDSNRSCFNRTVGSSRYQCSSQDSSTNWKPSFVSLIVNRIIKFLVQWCQRYHGISFSWLLAIFALCSGRWTSHPLLQSDEYS